MEDKIFYIKVLFLLNLLTIVLAFLSLNRLAGILFDFPLRIYLEHFLAGFYCPLLFMFMIYCALLFCSLFKKEIYFFKRKIEVFLLIIFSLIYIFFEILWQFFISFNVDSTLQFIVGIFGTLFLWYVLFKINSSNNIKL